MKARMLLFAILMAGTTLWSQNVLENIEQNIDQALSKSFQTEQDLIQPIIEKLEASFEKEEDNLVNYWLCFALYNKTVFQMVNQENDQAYKTVQKGIARLKALETPTSEDLALHGSLLSLSINFQPEIAALLSGEAGSLYDKAIKKNKNNLRAYLGIGRSDYYKPVEYGGGFKVESYLKQALSKPDKSSDEEFTPSWGREDAYFYLASFYQREGKTGEAKLYCNQGLKAFPNNRQLQSLKAKLQ